MMCTPAHKCTTLCLSFSETSLRIPVKVCDSNAPEKTTASKSLAMAESTAAAHITTTSTDESNKDSSSKGWKF